MSNEPSSGREWSWSDWKCVGRVQNSENYEISTGEVIIPEVGEPESVLYRRGREFTNYLDYGNKVLDTLTHGCAQVG